MIEFKPMWGTEAALPSEITPGRLYFTTDTGKIFLDLEGGTRKSFIPDGAVSGIPVPVTEGGTGASDASSALENLRGIRRDGDVVTGDITYTKGVTVLEDRDTDSPLQGWLYATDNSSGSGAVRIYASVKNSDQGYSAIEITPGSSGIKYVYYNGVGISSGPIYNFMSTIPVSNGGTGATTASSARTNLGAASDDHDHVVGQPFVEVILWAGTLNPGSSVSVANVDDYALVMVEVECGQFRATRTIRPDTGGYWCAVALPNDTCVVFQATTGIGAPVWKFLVDATTSSGGKVVGVYGISFKTTSISS